MARFVWVESSSTALNEQPRVLATQFGDGYSQRSPDGLNSRAQVWDVRLAKVDAAVGNEVIAFVREHNGVTAFDWTPRWETISRRFICKEWSRTQLDAWDQSEIALKFQQIFEP